MKRAIAHVDADAFFASVEQSLHPEYRGKPLVTGLERNIVSAASYEAKALGISRGIALWDVKKICPECIILPSDYETYSLYSFRLFEILRQYSPCVEEYSIDEAYVDLTGVSRLHRKSYRMIAEEIQKTVNKRLGIGVSVGLSVTKILAKLASGLEKPRGITIIEETGLMEFLSRIQVGKICGIGPKTVELLEKFGVRTAGDFSKLSEEAVKRYTGKIGLELWREIKGEMVYKVEDLPSKRYSIIKSKTFTPPSSNREFIFAQAVRNLESACIKAQRHRLISKRLILFLRLNDFSHTSFKIELFTPTNSPIEFIKELRRSFEAIFDSTKLYRATGIALEKMREIKEKQYSLFDNEERTEELECLYEEITKMSERYGKHVVSAGTSLYLKRKTDSSRATKPIRKEKLLPGETFRKRIRIPVWEIGE